MGLSCTKPTPEEQQRKEEAKLADHKQSWHILTSQVCYPLNASRNNHLTMKNLMKNLMKNHAAKDLIRITTTKD